MTDDQSFLDAIAANPGDNDLRLVYADWLEEQGDRRSEYLRVQVELGQVPDKQSKRRKVFRKRLRKLQEGIAPDWLARVDRTGIEGCAYQGAADTRRLLFKFECPKQWEQLQPTDEASVRFCDACKKEVYYCQTVEHAQRHANYGHCVAVDSSLVRRPDDLTIHPSVRPPLTAGVLGMLFAPIPRYRLGDRVEIRTGDFAGNRGVVKKLSLTHLRATVAVGAKGKLQVELDFEDMQPVYE